ncbi:MAG: hypothetical protein OCD00_12250 [Colwellia sp.]
MEIQSAFNSGVQGFQKATEEANRAAENIVASTAKRSNENVTAETQLASDASGNLASSISSNVASDTTINKVPDLNQSIVDLKVAEFQAKASTQVIKSADESLGTLLDVTA